MNFLLRVCWDACAWIAYFNEEKSVPLRGGKREDRFAKCREMIEVAKRGKLWIVTSEVSRAEVFKEVPDGKNLKHEFEKMIRREFVEVIPVDEGIRSLANALQQHERMNLKSADALHVATAQRSRAVAMHTFDRGILGIDGKLVDIAGNPIKVCKPALPPEVDDEGTGSQLD